MACNKSLPPAPPAANCGQSVCPCISTVQTAADSATSSALASAESALLAHKILQNCLTGNTIKPGGGLKYDEGTQPGEGGIYVNAADLAKPGGGLGVSDKKLIVNASDLVAANGGLKASGGKLAVDKSQLANAAGGLGVDSNGNLKLDFSQIPPAQLKPLLLGMIQTGGGLSVNSSGKIYFDAESMDKSVFEKMMKALHLPIWLGKDTSFFVDPSHAAAADTLVDGRGLSASLPFATVQAALDFVSANYNLSKYNAMIRLNSGVYAEDLVFGDITTNTGTLALMPYSGVSADSVIVQGAHTFRNSNCLLQDLIFRNRSGTLPSSTMFHMFTLTRASQVTTNRIKVDLAVNNSAATDIFSIEGGSSLALNGDDGGNGLVIAKGSAFAGTLMQVFILYNASVSQRTSIQVTGSPAMNSFVNLRNASIYNVGKPTAHTVEPSCSGEVTGKRYIATTNSIINTGGKGAEFFPGSEAGTTSTGAQYA